MNGLRRSGLAALALAIAIWGWACGSVEAPRPALLLITVDTLRADRLRVYGSNRELTPNLDRLARESEVFETMYAPASFTVPSIVTILTGQYPEQNAIVDNESILADGATTLAGLLGRHGYRTGAVVSNWVLRPGGGLEQGFGEYDASFPQLEETRKAPERVASETTDAALKMLDRLEAENAQPIFLWVHYQDPHGPYTPPDEFRDDVQAEEAVSTSQRLPFGENSRGLGSIPVYQRIGDHAEVAYYRSGYDAEVRYADAQIGRFLEALRERGFYDDGVIVFAADHGEGLGEHDYWFAHGEYLFDPLVRVPLFIRIPEGTPGRRSDVAGFVDLLPTLLSALGIATPSGLPGRDLLGDGARGASTTAYMATLAASTVPRYGLVSGGFKYLLTLRNGRMEEQLFRLGNESEDLAEGAAPELPRLRQEMGALRARFPATQREQRRKFRDDDRDKLRALGYASDP